MVGIMLDAILGLMLTTLPVAVAQSGPFLKQLNGTNWVIGNDLWNITQGPVYATKLYYDGSDAIGSAKGHYVGVDGENNFVWESANIASRGSDYIDISFNAATVEFHWVIFNDLAGAYQYVVNKNVSDLSILRSLWRLAPERFPNGRTYLKDGPLPNFALYANATKVQDETWQLANGTYITKYDWSNFVTERDFTGVYGDATGSWYIHPSTDYFPGGHLSQTLTVHRESATGDAVQLNVVQDTSHFRVGSVLAQPPGKIWGPWLWYLNDGSRVDAASKAKEERAKWPYTWLEDSAYRSRGSVAGSLTLSDGRPAAGAAVFLGDVDLATRLLIQGKNYYYSTYADQEGSFSFPHVRSGSYGVYAYANGGGIGDVYTNFTQSGISVSAGEETSLAGLTWDIPTDTERIFQVGDFDKKALGFKNGGPPYQHGLTEQGPANLTWTVGKSSVSDWYYAQSKLGTWTIQFDLPSLSPAYRNRTALLSVSLAGYSQSTALTIRVNGNTTLGSLSKDNLASDPALYRSGTTSGEWRFIQYPFNGGSVLKAGRNSVSFTVDRYTLWRGFLWDSIILEWA